MSVYWQSFEAEFKAVLDYGGPILWAMILLAVMLYLMLASTWLGLRRVKGEINSLDVTLEADTDQRQVETDVAMFELDNLAWVERRMPVISVMIALAPLAGLLGTVSGMLSTFRGMATQSASQPIDNISSGISEALVTTQVGLFMAIPAAFLFVIIKNRIEYVHGRLEKFESDKMIALKGGKV